MYRKQKIPTIKDSNGSINVDEQGLKCILEYELRKTIGRYFIMFILKRIIVVEAMEK